MSTPSPALIRNLSLNGGSAVAGAVAAIGFMSSHSVDLYAVWDQLNVVVADVTKLLAMVTPLVTMAYAAYKSTRGNQVKDVATAGTTVILPKEEQKLADSSSANVVTQAEVKVTPT